MIERALLAGTSEKEQAYHEAIQALIAVGEGFIAEANDPDRDPSAGNPTQRMIPQGDDQTKLSYNINSPTTYQRVWSRGETCIVTHYSISDSLVSLHENSFSISGESNNPSERGGLDTSSVWSLVRILEESEPRPKPVIETERFYRTREFLRKLMYVDGF